eukprot:scaffold9547_cov102-Isochrysis_galbana.AAC.4
MPGTILQALHTRSILPSGTIDREAPTSPLGAWASAACAGAAPLPTGKLCSRLDSPESGRPLEVWPMLEKKLDGLEGQSGNWAIMST